MTLTERLRNPADGWTGDASCVSAEDAAEAADRIEALEAFVADVADSLTDGSVIPNPSWESDDAEWLLDRARALQGEKQQS